MQAAAAGHCRAHRHIERGNGMEYIIKYTGDILALGYPTELLDAQFAIMELETQTARRLLEYRQINSYEPARRLSSLADRSLEAACIPPVQRKTGLGLTGQGVLSGLWTRAWIWTTRNFWERTGRPGWSPCGT